MSTTIWSIIVAATAVVCLAVGAGVGWYSHQRYIVAEMEAAFGEAEAEIDAALGDEPEGEDDGDGAQEAEEPAGPPEGEATDGVFDYTVTGVDTRDTYNDDSCGETYAADGEFAVVSIDADNVGDTPGEPAYYDVYAYDADGVQYSAHWDICTFADETNPGNSTSYEVVFDVPEGTELAALELASDVAPGLAVVPVE